MCGRFTQINGIVDYQEELGKQLPLFGGYDNVPIDRFNIAPHTKVRLFRMSPQGIAVDSVRWGWKPHWARPEMQPPINARVETVATNKFFKGIWPHRCIVPANGWYEWVQEGDIKQPYYIHLKSDKPMFFAGIGEFTGDEAKDGFVIITADSEGGMVDIHARRPIVLSPEEAKRWLDDTSPQEAMDILLNHSLNQNNFEWYKVNKAVGNVRSQGSKLIDPM